MYVLRLLKVKAHRLFLLSLIAVLAAPVTVSALPLGSALYAKSAPEIQGGNDLTWQLVASLPGVYWYTVYFPTPTIGYALGGPDWNNANGGSGPAYLGKTTDGGTSWAINLIPNTNRFMRGLVCTDANTCWISGASTNRIMFTTNGGATWQNSVIANNAWNGWLWSAGWTGTGATILTGTTGYCPDGDPDPNCPNRKANILRSADGNLFFPKAADDPREFVVYDFNCPVPGTCYAAAKQTAFYSGDNGDTWFRKVLPVGRYYGIWCTNATTCWEVGGSNGSANDGAFFIFRTTDGGASWQQQSSIPLANGRPRLYNIQMADSQNGYAVGCSNAFDPIVETCDGQGIIVKTTDGVTWQQIQAPPPPPPPYTGDIMDLWVHDRNSVIVVDFAGRIFRGTGVPEPGDPYEPDNSCSSANAVAPGGSAQDHTFHAAGDLDWVRFQATAGKRYVIAGRHTGPLADVMAWLYNGCSDPNPIQDNDFGTDTILTWTAPTNGVYYVRLANHDPGVFGAAVSYQVSVRAVSLGAAIITSGRLYTNERFQEQINYMTNHAYLVFYQAGYEHEDIYYLSADPVSPPHMDAPSLPANLGYAITSWAAERLQDGDPLYLYLADHGDPEVFYLNTGNNSITTLQLENWLQAFQNQRPNSPVVIIIEACKSGSFITPAQSLSGPGRIVVTATGDNNDSYANPAGQGGGYFSDPFFDALAQSYSLWDSYVLARQAALSQSGSHQTPWIDGDGDGLPYPVDTNDEGAGQHLGLGRPAGLSGDPPYIETPIMPPPAGGQPVPIRVQVFDEHRPSTSVWMMVTKPSTPPPSPPPGYTTPVSHAERVSLVYNPQIDRFEVAFAFDEAGRYQFEFYAEDASGQRAQPVTVDVYTGGRVYLPIILR